MHERKGRIPSGAWVRSHIYSHLCTIPQAKAFDLKVKSPNKSITIPLESNCRDSFYNVLHQQHPETSNKNHRPMMWRLILTPSAEARRPAGQPADRRTGQHFERPGEAEGAAWVLRAAPGPKDLEGPPSCRAEGRIGRKALQLRSFF